MEFHYFGLCFFHNLQPAKLMKTVFTAAFPAQISASEEYFLDYKDRLLYTPPIRPLSLEIDSLDLPPSP